MNTLLAGLAWPQQVPITAQQVHEQLFNGMPSIQTHATGTGNTFYLRPVALRPTDYQIVTDCSDIITLYIMYYYVYYYIIILL
jgi:hypothetical protein